MNVVLNFIIRCLSWHRKELKEKRLKMERFMEFPILGGFRRKRKYNEAMQEVEYHFHLSYKEVDEVVPLIAETAVTEKASKRAK